MPLIGEGGYGCVFKPSLICANDQSNAASYKDKISKYIIHRHAETELSETKEVTDMDKKEKYHVGTPTMCNPLPDSIKKEKDMTKCGMRKNPEKKVLLIMNDGGHSLTDWLDDKSRLLTAFGGADGPKKVRKFWIAAMNLINGVELFQKNGFIHNDIKPDNIVYNPKKNEFKYIDFGISEKKQDSIKKAANNNSLVGNKYFWSIPFEQRFINVNDYNNLILYANNSISNSISSLNDIDIAVKFSNRVQLKKSIRKLSGIELYSQYVNGSYAVTDVMANVWVIDSVASVLYHSTYNNFVNASLDSRDTYGVGFSLLHAAHVFYANALITQHTFECFRDLFSKMCSSFLPGRMSNFGQIKYLYQSCIDTFGVKNTPKVLTKKKLSAIKNQPGYNLTRSPSTGNITKKCSPTHELNPTTNRCIKRCIPEKIRSEKTRRCIKKCDPTKQFRNKDSGRCKNFTIKKVNKKK